MNESHLQATVIDICKMYGIAWYHTHDSRRSVPGWPDLAMCGGHGFMLRELKTVRGQLSPEQERWGWMLRQAGQDWDVWRPTDLMSGRIQRELEGIR